MSYLSDSSRLKKFLQERYLNLPQGEFCQVTYVWIAYCGVDLFSTEMLLIPVCFMFRGPFLLDPNKLVLCEVLKHTRQPAIEIMLKCLQSTLVMEKVKELHPWFGMEQEYTLLGVNGHPLSDSNYILSLCLYSYSCGVDYAIFRTISLTLLGVHNKYRPIIHAHLASKAGSLISGKFHQVLLEPLLTDKLRKSMLIMNLDLRSLSVNNGSAQVTQNFNDSYRRNITTHRPIITPVHCRKGPSGGKDNKRRLIGCQVFSSSYDFSAGVANHGASIRIPYRVAENKCGYFQDRHPAANCGPYVVTCTVACTCMLKEEEELK
uniref:Glutamate-ammonia ligase (glutamine synthase) c n=1 Tax=Cyprinus carpio TaxID=7962 RepID=A0A8C1INN0_CYPCA